MQSTFRFTKGSHNGAVPFRKLAMAILLGLLLTGPSFARTVEVAQPFPIGLSLFAPLQFPANDVSVNGMRLSLVYGYHKDVMGLDLGAFVSAVEGDVFGLELSGLVNIVGSSSGSVQIAGIANNCYEDFCGCQLSGIANRAGGLLQGGQIGCFNLAGDLSGIQLGVYNKATSAIGLQIGVVNEAATMQGIQIGLINMIRQSPVPFCPIVNMYF